MQNPRNVKQAVDWLVERMHEAGAERPEIGLVLGTGLGGLARAAELSFSVDYADIPGFPVSTVSSHAGRLSFGNLSGKPVVLQEGRFHLYEGYAPEDVAMAVRTMAGLGVTTYVVTNAAGCLNPRWNAGELMAISDHVNRTGVSPLTGPNHDEWGVRFPDMSAVYDPELLETALAVAREERVALHSGVYVGVRGPELETPAETRAYRQLGGDAIGMSTVVEVIAARHLGLRILGISCLTNKNLPDCMAEATLEEIIAAADQAGSEVARLLTALLKKL